MNKLIDFFKYFGLCFIFSIIGWLIIGGILSLFIPAITLTVILHAGVGTGIGCGLINGLFAVFS
jgi:hypothetical protein